MLNSCGTRTQLPRGTQDLPRSDLCVLADRFFTTEPPGKSLILHFEPFLFPESLYLYLTLHIRENSISKIVQQNILRYLQA